MSEPIEREEWAKWVLFGNDAAPHVPDFHPLRNLMDRIKQAIQQSSASERTERNTLAAEVERLKLCIQSAAGDDLCRLTQEEIKAYTSGAVQIPPKEEFIPSCERFHQQIADGPGVLDKCLTLAQLIAENERLRGLLAKYQADQERRDMYDALDFSAD